MSENHWKWFLTAFVVLFVCTQSAATATERITDFSCDIDVGADGIMTVTETIKVITEGKKISRGIYRDIPIRYGGGGLAGFTNVPIEILRIQRDGHDEPYHTEKREMGAVERIYIGRKSHRLDPGAYTYVITYATSQVRFYDDHDEVYWNVTGHAWEFPIDRATASVVLPAKMPVDSVKAEAYVGPLGSKNQRNIQCTVDPQSPRVEFKTTQPLQTQEGVTIVVQFAKGFVDEPTVLSRVFDDGYILRMLLALVLVTGYFSLTWWFVGRDPATGVVIPEFAPPNTLSPGAVRFIDRMGFDKECFSTAILSLASQGSLDIREVNQKYTLSRKVNDVAGASLGEKKVFRDLLGPRSEITIDKAHHKVFSKAIESLKKSLMKEFEGDLFRVNRMWFFFGVILSVVSVNAVVFFDGWSNATGKVAFILLWLSIWSTVVAVLIHALIRSWWGVFIGGGISPVSGIVKASWLTLFSIPFVTGEFVAIVFLATETSLWIVPLLLGIIGVNVLFYELIKAPTGKGRAIMDRIDGFRMYLSTAEKDRLEQMTSNSQDGTPPEQTLATFERFLPYAVALGVANQWAEQFQDLVSAASANPGAESHYQPSWYHGQSWSPASMGAMAAGIGSAMTSAVAAAATSPSSSSGGGGGGFSGGGGGGGGGGGW